VTPFCLKDKNNKKGMIIMNNRRQYLEKCRERIRLLYAKRHLLRQILIRELQKERPHHRMGR